MKSSVLKWYPLLAFICMLYSIARISRKARRSFIFGSLARNNFIIRNSNPSEEENHEYKFFIIEA
jgi:hypothetical protein